MSDILSILMVGENSYEVQDAVLRTSSVRYDIVQNKNASQMAQARANIGLTGTKLDVISEGAVGDGVSDDSAVINQCIQKVVAKGGGIIHFSPGTYKINNPIVLFSNITLDLDNGAVILRGSNINFMLLSNCTDSVLSYDGIYNVTIQGGTIDIGEGFTQGCCAAGFIHASKIRIKDVTMKHNNAGYHFLDICGCQNVIIENCIFKDSLTTQSSAEFIQLDGAGSYTQFPSPQLTNGATTFDGTADEDIEIRGCRFELNSYSPAFGNHNAQANKNINVHDNVIVGTGGDRGAVAFAHNNEETVTNQTTQVLIHHNIFEGCSIGFTFSTVGNGKIYVRDNIFKNIAQLKKYPDSPVGQFLNNIELA